MRVLALDLGKVRTGVAMSDTTGTLASPLCVIKETNKGKLLNHVIELVKKYGVKVIVVGFPKNMDGTQGESAKNSLKFKEDLKSLVDCEVLLVDERWSTKSAQYYLNVGTTKSRKKKSVIDGVAAAVILQQYLDSNKRKL